MIIARRNVGKVINFKPFQLQNHCGLRLSLATPFPTALRRFSMAEQQQQHITETAEKVVKKARVLPLSIPLIPKTDNIDHLKPIIWIDCEMTGLDTFNDHIIEICCIVTDKDLNIIDEAGYESVVHYDEEVMGAMNQWCIDHHGQSGLTEKVVKSTKTLEQVESELLLYISKYCSRNVGILAGNTVHMDRIFMVREMPKVMDYLFYRIIDVSSIMEVGKRHNPRLVEKCPKKVGAHTAKADILESIEQLRWYRDHYLVQPIAEEALVEEKKEETTT